MCSRREAEKLIVAGRVTINGDSTQLGNRVFDGDIVKVDGRALQAKPKTVYIAFNKPVGIVCTTDSKEKNNIVRYINHPERLFPIGRLDKPSEGLIFLTNDGDIVNKILRAVVSHAAAIVVTVTGCGKHGRYIEIMSSTVRALIHSHSVNVTCRHGALTAPS